MSAASSLICKVKSDDLASSLLSSGTRPVVLEDPADRAAALTYLRTALQSGRGVEDDTDVEEESSFPASREREYLIRFGYNRSYISVDSSVVRMATAKQTK